MIHFEIKTTVNYYFTKYCILEQIGRVMVTSEVREVYLRSGSAMFTQETVREEKGMFFGENMVFLTQRDDFVVTWEQFEYDNCCKERRGKEWPDLDDNCAQPMFGLAILRNQ